MGAPEREAYRQGRLCYERGDAEAALGHLSFVLATCPRFADVHYLVGLIHDDQGDADAAAESFREAIRINPGYAEASLALASVYERSGQFERTRALFEGLRPSALDASGTPPIEPGSPDPTTRAKLANLHAALGDAYREVGDLREAIDAYRRALERCPTFHDIRQRLGVALREAGLASQAVQEFRRILRANARYLDAAVQLGLTYYSLGRASEAAAQWEGVLEMDPSRDDARMYLRMVQGAGRSATGT